MHFGGDVVIRIGFYIDPDACGLIPLARIDLSINARLGLNSGNVVVGQLLSVELRRGESHENECEENKTRAELNAGVFGELHFYGCFVSQLARLFLVGTGRNCTCGRAMPCALKLGRIITFDAHKRKGLQLGRSLL